MMIKNELIEAITSVNKSATRDFLSEFGERELYDYVRQLESVGKPVHAEESHGARSGTSDRAVIV